MSTVLILSSGKQENFAALFSCLQVVETTGATVLVAERNAARRIKWETFLQNNPARRTVKIIDDVDADQLAPSLVLFNDPSLLKQALRLRKKLNCLLVYYMPTGSREYQLQDYYEIHCILSADQRTREALPSYVLHRIIMIDVNTVQQAKQLPTKTAIHYYVSGSDADLSLLRKILPLFNSTYEKKFLVIGEKTVYDLIKHEHNDNISFAEQPDHRPSIVIGDGDGMSTHLANGIPVIVLGKYGFGGMVDGENWMAHLANHFKGRIGGYCDEYIPLELVQHELETVWNNHGSITKTIREIAPALNKEIAIRHQKAKAAFSALIKRQTQSSIDFNRNYRLMLYPDIYFPKTKKDEQVFIGRINEVVLAALPVDHKPLLEALSEGCTLSHLQETFTSIDVVNLLEELYRINALEIIDESAGGTA